MRARAALTAVAAVTTVASAAPTMTPVAAGETPRNCAWAARLDPTALNTLYPDQAANYWISVLPAAPGAGLTITGIYPHARYISFTTYDVALRAVDGVNDQRIDPDPGSINPFLPGAPRRVPHRSYTVDVVFGQRPTNAPHNVVYTTSADGSLSAQYFIVVYRVYRADRGLDITGGVGLPSIAYTAGGVTTPIPQCPYPIPPPNDVNQTIANSGSATSNQLLRYPGTNPPVFHKFFNQPTGTVQAATDNGYSGTTIGSALSPYTMQLPRGGFLQNLDNAYVFAQLTHGYGNIAVIHAKLPTFPQTYDGEPIMGTGQLRYWSLCTNDGPSQRYYGCLTDDQVVLDSSGFYTIVISTAAGMPPNATLQCGVNWLPWGPNSASLVIVRNMLPDPTFTQSIQDARYGSEAQDMGSYYPSTSGPGSPNHATYMSTADFVKRGCPAAG